MTQTTNDTIDWISCFYFCNRLNLTVVSSFGNIFHPWFPCKVLFFHFGCALWWFFLVYISDHFISSSCIIWICECVIVYLFYRIIGSSIGVHVVGKILNYMLFVKELLVNMVTIYLQIQFFSQAKGYTSTQIYGHIYVYSHICIHMYPWYIRYKLINYLILISLPIVFRHN